jgi:hypothetical protein
MGIAGRGGDTGPLSYLSLYTTRTHGGGGTVIFSFDQTDRVASFDAFIERANNEGHGMEVIWSPEYFCSDLPSSRKRCNK